MFKHCCEHFHEHFLLFPFCHIVAPDLTRESQPDCVLDFRDLQQIYVAWVPWPFVTFPSFVSILQVQGFRHPFIKKGLQLVMDISPHCQDQGNFRGPCCPGTVLLISRGLARGPGGILASARSNVSTGSGSRSIFRRYYYRGRCVLAVCVTDSCIVTEQIINQVVFFILFLPLIFIITAPPSFNFKEGLT